MGKKSVKKIRKKIMAVLLLVSILAVNLQDSKMGIVQAAAGGSGYLNVTKKYLYLGDKELSTFQFKVRNAGVGAKYSWGIMKEKGDPNAVSINQKTGVVTAREVGSAYIYCKITKSDTTVVKQEATVIVRNKIKDIAIRNVYNRQTVSAGSELKFGFEVLNTEDGSDARYSDIIRWEIKSDKSDTKVSEDGRVTPAKKGSFQIRAVCFQSKSNYSSWLKNKEDNAKNVTASSQWYTIIVENNVKEALVATQSQLDAALRDTKSTLINITTEKEIELKIAKGNYKTKRIFVNAPNADITNEGSFKNVVIQAIKPSTWIEFADGNTIYLDSVEARIIIQENSHIKEIIIDQPSSDMNIVAHGKVDKVTLLQPSQVILSGKSKNVAVTVEDTAVGSVLSSSVPIALEMKADTKIALYEGAEGSTINRADETVGVSVDNKTQDQIKIVTDNAASQVVNAGDSATYGKKSDSNDSAPTVVPTATPTSVPSVPTTVPAPVPTAPTTAPTIAPTTAPTIAPTEEPTAVPTIAPTTAPTEEPTVAPTGVPTEVPTAAPTAIPTVAPTAIPTVAPTAIPTVAPTAVPSVAPTAVPTVAPTAVPTIEPTVVPTAVPTVEPTVAPTAVPTVTPTVAPTEVPTATPTPTPVILVAVADNVETDEHVPITIDVLENDTYFGDPVVKVIYTPQNGKTVVEDSKIIYTPGENFYGQDTFSYYLRVGTSESKLAKVTIEVKRSLDHPDLQMDDIIMFEDETFTFKPLQNDTINNWKEYTYEFRKDPSSGNIELKSEWNENTGELTLKPLSSKYTQTGKSKILYTVKGKGYTSKSEINITLIPRKETINIEHKQTVTYTIKRAGYYDVFLKYGPLGRLIFYIKTIEGYNVASKEYQGGVEIRNLKLAAKTYKFNFDADYIYSGTIEIVAK